MCVCVCVCVCSAAGARGDDGEEGGGHEAGVEEDLLQQTPTLLSGGDGAHGATPQTHQCPT